MKKILIIGSSGAGKSTFARRLGEATGLPVIHLDRLFWNAGWVETPKEEWRERVEKFLRENDRWIMDGNFSGTMEMRMTAADTVIFLETPRTVCIYRILKRVVFYRPGKRPDMADGCDERFNWEFLKWVWDYPNRTKPKVESLLGKYGAGKQVFRFKNKSETDRFLVSRFADQESQGCGGPVG
jgi:adenylate kinase family enzyme